MKKYWTYYQLSLQRALADRADLYLEIFGSIMFTLAVVAVWYAAAQGKDGVAGMERNVLITYLLIAGLCMSMYRRAQGDEVSDDIYNGVLSGYLTKPVNPLMLWWVRDMAMRTLEIPVVGGLGLAVGLALPEEMRLLGFHGLLLFLVPCAWLLHFFMYTTLALCAFWLEQTWGERFVLNVIMEMASGAMVPLAFFPHAWGTILRYLPFSHLVATPVEFLIGMRNIEHDYLFLMIMAGWIAAGYLIMCGVWRVGLKKYEGVGI